MGRSVRNWTLRSVCDSFGRDVEVNTASCGQGRGSRVSVGRYGTSFAQDQGASIAKHVLRPHLSKCVSNTLQPSPPRHTEHHSRRDHTRTHKRQAHARTHTHNCAQTHTRTHSTTPTCTRQHTHTDNHMHITRTHTQTHTHAGTHTQTHTHAGTHTHTHTHTSLDFNV